ncbi:MAG: hypothetical protein M9962_10635 [Oligoflexia bacterium]|nr:hypothetical protein [Oligoflexia bacterium]
MKRIFKKKAEKFLSKKKCSLLSSQSGQAIVEYLLILILALTFTRLVFFNKDVGFKAQLDKTMLRIGSFLEQNLKTGTQVGGDGQRSLDAYAGTERWNN